eukprot:364471-Chlamydomonas_euryale.AAC.3
MDMLKSLLLHSSSPTACIPLTLRTPLVPHAQVSGCMQTTHAAFPYHSRHMRKSQALCRSLTPHAHHSRRTQTTHAECARARPHAYHSRRTHTIHAACAEATLHADHSRRTQGPGCMQTAHQFMCMNCVACRPSRGTPGVPFQTLSNPSTAQRLAMQSAGQFRPVPRRQPTHPRWRASAPCGVRSGHGRGALPASPVNAAVVAAAAAAASSVRRAREQPAARPRARRARDGRRRRGEHRRTDAVAGRRRGVLRAGGEAAATGRPRVGAIALRADGGSGGGSSGGGHRWRPSLASQPRWLGCHTGRVEGCVCAHAHPHANRRRSVVALSTCCGFTHINARATAHTRCCRPAHLMLSAAAAPLSADLCKRVPILRMHACMHACVLEGACTLGWRLLPRPLSIPRRRPAAPLPSNRPQQTCMGWTDVHLLDLEAVGSQLRPVQHARVASTLSHPGSDDLRARRRHAALDSAAPRRYRTTHLETRCSTAFSTSSRTNRWEAAGGAGVQARRRSKARGLAHLPVCRNSASVLKGFLGPPLPAAAAAAAAPSTAAGRRDAAVRGANKADARHHGE